MLVIKAKVKLLLYSVMHNAMKVLGWVELQLRAFLTLVLSRMSGQFDTHSLHHRSKSPWQKLVRGCLLPGVRMESVEGEIEPRFSDPASRIMMITPKLQGKIWSLCLY
jgi:hypothetical protein